VCLDDGDENGIEADSDQQNEKGGNGKDDSSGVYMSCMHVSFAFDQVGGMMITTTTKATMRTAAMDLVWETKSIRKIA
jgi:hypothetical protein